MLRIRELSVLESIFRQKGRQSTKCAQTRDNKQPAPQGSDRHDDEWRDEEEKRRQVDTVINWQRSGFLKASYCYYIVALINEVNLGLNNRLLRALNMATLKIITIINEVL